MFPALFKNVRFYVLAFSLVLSAALHAAVVSLVPEGTLQTIRLTQIYALTALTYLYLALLIGPAIYVFTFLPWRGYIYRSRRAVGVSAFYFACLHAYLAFFKQLGGFRGLPFLDNNYLIAISLSFTALVILALMASTSFDAMVRRLSMKRWKFLHRFIYLAGILILIHALMLGTHFAVLSDIIPQIFFVAFFFLLLLEANRFDAYLARVFHWQARFGISFVAVVSAIVVYVFLSFFPSNALPSLGVHSQHILQAQQAATQPTSNPLLTKGDATKRYTVSFYPPATVQGGQEVSLRFKVSDASNGNPVELFTPVYGKAIHLVVVDSSLNYFNHIHPTQDKDGFIIATTFPKDGLYRLYVNFQPLGALEQQFAFTLPVGSGTTGVSTHEADASDTKIVGKYAITLQAPKPLLAAQLSTGVQTLRFVIRDAVTQEPITTLQPYLEAYGHLAMINQDTFDYLHVHPTNVLPTGSTALGGPNVDFTPLGLYGPIKPGTYRLFAQFNPNGELIVTDFTVKVE